MVSFVGRVLVRAGAAVLLALVIIGLPVGLILAIGWPLPDHLPHTAELGHALTQPVSDRAVLDLLAVAAWLLWAAFTHAVLAEARAAARGVPSQPAVPLPFHPMRSVAATIITALTLGTVLSAAASAAPPAAARTSTGPATPTHAVSASMPIQEGPLVIHVGDARYVYIVKRGDYLSKIANAWLGDADRWPEICDLNRHRHFPQVGGTLTDCNLIYPGWDLKLPADARPPASLTPTIPTPKPQPSTPDSQGATSVPTATPTPTPTASSSLMPSPSPAATSTPSPSASPTGQASTQPAPATASPTTAPTPTAARSGQVRSDQHGVSLPGGAWLPWMLVAAIPAAAALVWLQRRRRFDPDNPEELVDLPEPVTALARAAIRNPDIDTPTDEAEQAATVPDQPLPPPGGVGLVGDGAHAAARAALVAVLSSGGPRDPHRCGEAVIDANTLTTLIGSDAVTLGPWPRLHVADDIDDALRIVEAAMLHRSRAVDEYDVTDIDTLREVAPDEEALPPILLISDIPPPGARMRARVSLGIGQALKVSALLLGEWGHGVTIDVDAEGHTDIISGETTEPIPPRMPVLPADTAVQLLATLREAQTGTQPVIHSTSNPAVPIPLATDTTGGEQAPDTPRAPMADPPEVSDTNDEAATQEQAAPATVPTPRVAAEGPRPANRPKARLRVLGTPGIDNVADGGEPLRAKALELAVLLACHPDGKSTREIGEYLSPDAHLHQADQQVHKNVSNLRQAFGRAAGHARDSYITKANGRYQLDPATVDVDVWHVRDLMRNLRTADDDERVQILRKVCDLIAPLAENQDYEWITAHRETVRQWSTHAHSQLAQAVLDDDPHQASDVLDKAIAMDKYNEKLYVLAMRARHAIGDRDGIKALLRACTRAMADLGEEPAEETVALAQRLRALA